MILVLYDPMQGLHNDERRLLLPSLNDAAPADSYCNAKGQCGVS
jgi:hypothetical protein